MIGRAGLLAVDPVTWQGGSRFEIGERAKIEIGWTFERQAWGQGYAFEAADGIRDWAATTLDLRELVSIIQLGNTRSLRLAARLGERRERRIITSFGKPAWLYTLVLASDEPKPGSPALRPVRDPGLRRPRSLNLSTRIAHVRGLQAKWQPERAADLQPGVSTAPTGPDGMARAT